MPERKPQQIEYRTEELLPYEWAYVRYKLGKLTVASSGAEEDLAHSMSLGADGWHDNAAWDAAVEAMGHLDSKSRTWAAWSRAPMANYPSEGPAQLGSRIILVDSWDDREVYDIGQIRPTEMLPDDSIITVVQSPLAKALLGLNAGDSGEYVPREGARPIGFDVVEVDHSSVRKHWESITELNRILDLARAEDIVQGWVEEATAE